MALRSVAYHLWSSFDESFGSTRAELTMVALLPARCSRRVSDGNPPRQPPRQRRGVDPHPIPSRHRLHRQGCHLGGWPAPTPSARRSPRRPGGTAPAPLPEHAGPARSTPVTASAGSWHNVKGRSRARLEPCTRHAGAGAIGISHRMTALPRKARGDRRRRHPHHTTPHRLAARDAPSPRQDRLRQLTSPMRNAQVGHHVARRPAGS